MEENNIPKASLRDAAYATFVVGLNLIPVIGGSAAALFNALLTPSLTKRKDKWMQSLADGLVELQETNAKITAENLINNEEFITAVMQTTQIAMRNHENEKLDALKNAVLHIANESVETNMHAMFINLIDVMTPWHIKLLRFFHDPVAVAGQSANQYGSSMGSIGKALNDVYTDLKTNESFRNQLVLDLYNRGLTKVDTGMLNIMMTSQGAYESRTTNYGDDFLAFISAV
jgi:hypothetical protein